MEDPNNGHRIPLREHVDEIVTRIDEKILLTREMIEVRLTAMSEAVRVYKEVTDARLEGMNGIRNQLKEHAGTFITRMEYESKHAILQNDISGLRESRAELQGKASQKSVTTAYFLSGFGLIIAVIGLVEALST